MKNLRALVLVLSIGAAATVVGCIVKNAQNQPPVATAPGWHHESAYLVSTFQGTFSIGKTRVRASDKPEDLKTTALLVANLQKNGQARWMRSFPGIAPGRAAAFANVGKNVAVVGVFAGALNFDRQEQMLKSGDREGLFVAVFDPKGRAVAANLIGRAKHLSTPDVMVQGDRVMVSVPYDGAGDIGGKELPPGTGKSVVRINLSTDGKLINFEPPRAMLDPAKAPTQGKLAQGTFIDGKPAPGAGLVMASMQGATCNICTIDLPTTDPNCAGCRAMVCPGDSWCCDTGWDHICMDEAFDRCGSSLRTCICPHGTCELGVWMHWRCEEGTPRGNCVQRVCTGDSYCGTMEWDPTCVAESPAWCAAPGCF